MVTLIWNILGLLGVCSFPMWVMFAEGILFFILLLVHTGSTMNSGSDGFTNDIISNILGGISMGYVYFSVASMWMGLSLNGWFFLLAPLWFIIAFLFPGGLTITHLALNAAGLMTVPVWVWIVNGILDVIMIAVPLWSIITTAKEKRARR